MTESHRYFSAKVPLSSRAQVDRLDAGLCSVRGAQEVISMISSRRTVTKLVLGHNKLGDEGCTVLFKFLGSEFGRRYPISEISLNSNEIGNGGMLAIAQYLKDNVYLRELFLQGNAFTGDSFVTSVFVDALNSSYLEFLSLTTNHTLGDTFVEHFLPSLQAPHLRELHLSTIGLTARSARHIAAFVRSPLRCRLHTLGCNGNSLGIRGVRSVIRSVEQSNYSLLATELYANQVSRQDQGINNGGGLGNDFDSDSDDGDLSDGSFVAWRACQMRLNYLRIRNTHLKRETEQQALHLLRYSRALLLHTAIDHHTSSTPSDLSTRRSDDSSSTPSSSVESQTQPINSKSAAFPFISLPTELQLYILSFLAPSLSSAQRNRVVRYASSPETLPRMLPRLPRVPHSDPACVPDPSHLAFGMGGGTKKVWAVTEGGTGTGGCAGEHCMSLRNPVVCNREKERARWLEAVGCTIYEPEGRGVWGQALLTPG